METVNSEKLSILLLGPYPPPFGGISSLIVSLIGGLKLEESDEVFVSSFGEEKKVKQIDSATIYEFSILRNSFKLFNPLNWSLILKSFKVYSGGGVQF